MKRYGVEGGKGMGGQHMPFARAVEADGWLYVSGQVPMVNGVLVEGNIDRQSRQAIDNLFAVLTEAGYTAADVVRCGVWLDDARDFAAFNRIFREYFWGQSARPFMRGFQHDGRLQGRDRLCRVQAAREVIFYGFN